MGERQIAKINQEINEMYEIIKLYSFPFIFGEKQVLVFIYRYDMLINLIQPKPSKKTVSGRIQKLCDCKKLIPIDGNGFYCICKDEEEYYIIDSVKKEGCNFRLNKNCYIDNEDFEAIKIVFNDMIICKEKYKEKKGKVEYKEKYIFIYRYILDYCIEPKNNAFGYHVFINTKYLYNHIIEKFEEYYKLAIICTVVKNKDEEELDTVKKYCDLLEKGMTSPYMKIKELDIVNALNKFIKAGLIVLSPIYKTSNDSNKKQNAGVYIINNPKILDLLKVK